MGAPSDAEMLASYKGSQGAPQAGAAPDLSSEEQAWLSRQYVPADATLHRATSGELVGYSSPSEGMGVFVGGGPKATAPASGPLDTSNPSGPSDAEVLADYQRAQSQAAPPPPPQAPPAAPAFSSPGAFMQAESNGARDFMNGLTFGSVDRLNAGLQSLPALAQAAPSALSALAQIPSHGLQPLETALAPVGQAFSRGMDQQQALDNNHPGIAHTINGFAGNVAQAAFLPEVGASTVVGRAAVGAGQGALLGGLDGIGNTRGDIGKMFKGGAAPAAVGALIGGPLGAAFGPGGKAAIEQIAKPADYARSGVDQMLAVNGSQSMQRVGQMVKGLPFVGAPINAAASRTVGQVDKGVQRVAQNLGRSTTPFEAGGHLQQGANYAVSAMGHKGSSLYAPINALEKNTTPVAVNHGQEAIKGIFDQFQTPAMKEWAQANAPELMKVHKALTSAGGKVTFAELRALRSDIGKMIKGDLTIGNIDQGRLKQVYGALSEDLKAGARQLGGPKAEQALSRADKFNAAMHKRVDDALDTIIKADSREKAFTKVVDMARSTARGDTAQLSQITRSLPPEARREFAAGVIQTLGRDADGGFSVAKFATDWGKLTPQGRRAIIGNADQVEDLNALARIANQMKAADKFYNHSNSGHMTAGVVAAESALDATKALLEGHMTPGHMIKEAVGVTALYALAGGAAHLLASPGFAKLVLKANRASSVAEQRAVQDMLARYANDNQPIKREVLAYTTELGRRFKSNAPVVSGTAIPAQARRDARVAR